MTRDATGIHFRLTHRLSSPHRAPSGANPGSTSLMPKSTKAVLCKKKKEGDFHFHVIYRILCRHNGFIKNIEVSIIVSSECSCYFATFSSVILFFSQKKTEKTEKNRKIEKKV